MRLISVTLLCCCVMLVAGCGHPRGISQGGARFDGPDGKVRCSFFARDGKIIVAIYEQDDSSRSIGGEFAGLLSYDKVKQSEAYKDAEGRLVEVDALHWQHGAGELIVMGNTYDITQGEVFLVAHEDGEMTITQVDHQFEDTGRSFHEMSEHGEKIVTDLAETNTEIREFIDDKTGGGQAISP